MPIDPMEIVKALGLNWYWLLAAALVAKAVVKVWLELKLPNELTSLVSYLAAFIVLVLAWQPWQQGAPGWASSLVGAIVAGTAEIAWYRQAKAISEASAPADKQ